MFRNYRVWQRHLRIFMNTSWVMGDGDPLDDALRDMALSDIGVPLGVQSYVRSEWLSAWQRDTSWLQRHFCKVIDGRGAADDGREALDELRTMLDR